MGRLASPRRAVAAALLLVLGAASASNLSPSEVAARARMLVSGARAAGTGFWFDPEYAAFLDDVARRTPKHATIAVLVPERPDLYLYQAAYRLAPRRVVLPDRVGEAKFVAAYGHRGGGGPKAIPVSHGTLFRR